MEEKTLDELKVIAFDLAVELNKLQQQAMPIQKKLKEVHELIAKK